MIEKWKRIDNTDYFISNLARVKSIKKGKERILKLFKSNNKNAYYQVSLSIKGVVTIKYIHRLVMIAFVDNKKNKTEVNHKNGNKLDNRLENLEWATHKENMVHAKITGLSPKRTWSKLLEKDIPIIRSKYKSGRYYQKDIANEFNVSLSTINGIILNNHWR